MTSGFLRPSRKRHKSANTLLSLFLLKKSESRVCETERMTIKKIYWPMGLGPDNGKTPSPIRPKIFL